MGDLVPRAGALALLFWALSAVGAAAAVAEPGSGSRETVDQGFTTQSPGAATGLEFSASYHAAGDPSGNPPAMKQMVMVPPAGMRFDTSVPERCTASDLQLEVQGPAACPAGSRLGQGVAEGLFFVPFAHDFTFDRYEHNIYVLNNTGEQIVLVESEGFTIVRGRFGPDGSLTFEQPTCFPSPPGGQCADDYIVQLASSSVLPAYSTPSGSYATTPPTCPADGQWRTTYRFSWADGSTDSVVSTQLCGAA